MNDDTTWDIDALATMADANLVTHAGWVQRRLSGMQVIEAPDLVVIDSGLACDTFNIVCAARLSLATAPARVEAAVAHFRDVRRPFAWWMGPADRPRELGATLLAAGLHAAGGELAMAVDLSGVRSDDLSPGGLSIEQVRLPSQVADFAHVVAANWKPPDSHVTRFYDLATPLLLAPDAALRLYVGYLDDMPVATAELAVGGGGVGLYNVCTLAAYRRRGFGTALTLRPLLDARAEGHRVGVLQASAAGARVYGRLGFKPFGDIVEYKPPAPGN